MLTVEPCRPTRPGTRPGGPWLSVCGTGHRALTDDQDRWLRRRLTDGLRWLRDERDTGVVYTGMARGYDLLLAETVLEVGGFQLGAFIPFAEQTRPWEKSRAGRDDIRRWHQVLAAAAPDLVHTVGELPADVPAARRSAVVNMQLYARNHAMLAAVDGLLAGWDRRKFDGGTHGTVFEAVRRGMPGVHLDPVAETVRYLPRDIDHVTRAGLYHRDCGCVAWVASVADVRRAAEVAGRAGHPQWRVRKLPARAEWSQQCSRCAADPSRETVPGVS